MPNRHYIWWFILLIVSSVAHAQLKTDADFKRQVYDRAYTASVMFHTRGYAINGRYMKYVDGYNMRGFEIDLSKLRHPKEVITSSESLSNARGYVVGRINSFYTLRMGYFYQNILYDKTDRGSVAISWIVSGGPSLGLLKPIYLQWRQRAMDGRLQRIVTERYTGQSLPNIEGEANFFVGMDELSIQPGLYLKTGFEFDYQVMDERITSLEAGVIYDYFFTPVPIFFEENAGDVNWTGYLQFYLAANFGYKKN